MARALITQSNYIPWKGYFDNIAQCDVFVVYDDMQFTKRDWRNRNMIKTAQGLQWLTVPVEVKGKFDQRINEVRIADPEWRGKHLERLRHAYAKAPHFAQVFPWVQEVYREAVQLRLTELNVHFIRAVCERLGITTAIRDSRSFPLVGDRNEKLAGICRQLGASEYLTGPAARAYLDEEVFRRGSVKVVYADYGGFPAYAQLHPPFVHGVSILDVLFNCGDAARDAVVRKVTDSIDRGLERNDKEQAHE